MNLKFAFSLFFTASLCGAAPIYYMETSHTGAQTQIDVNHTSTWVFTPNINFDLGGGLFQMKDGSNASDTVAFSLFQGSDATGPLLGFVSMTNTNFCAQVGNCGQFEYHQFSFSTPVPVVTGTMYFAELTSMAADLQNQAYFIKSDTYISDDTGTAIDPQPIGSSANAPEPGTLVLIGLGLAVCGVRHRLCSRQGGQTSKAS